MKYLRYILFVLIVTSFFACRKDKDISGAIWKVDPLETYKIDPIPGGANITYNIPRDSNILFVEAVYKRGGDTYTQKASVYNDTLVIKGFNTIKQVNVNLFLVNRKGKKSPPTLLQFRPLRSPVKVAFDSLTLSPTFGGLFTSWYNPTGTPLGVRLMVDKRDSGLVTQDVFYSTSKNASHSFRGFDTTERKFAVAIEDKWGNISDTSYITTKPYFEVMIPKPYKDYRSVIPYDNTSTRFGGSFYNIKQVWDNIIHTASNGWVSSAGESGLSITIDMQQVAKLSRVVINPYGSNLFGGWGWTTISVYGIKDIDLSKLGDKAYWLDEYSVRLGAIHEVPKETVLPDTTFEDVWENLGTYSVPRYDLMDPPDQKAIDNLNQDGWDVKLPITASPVRYIRIFIRQTGFNPPPNNNYIALEEITFYGDNTVSQH